MKIKILSNLATKVSTRTIWSIIIFWRTSFSDCLSRGTMPEFSNLLHDDALISIGEYVGKLYGPEAYIPLALTCRKMKHLLLSNETNSSETIRNIIQFRVEKVTSSQDDFSIKTLEELAIFEQWCTTPLHSSYHHIPFPLASLEVDESMHEKIFAIINIMERFPSITVQLDSHCGIIAPIVLLRRFHEVEARLYVMFFDVIHRVYKLQDMGNVLPIR